MDFLAGLGSSAASFGLNYASMLLSAKEQRSLRRTAYQDQMHSMKAAGLNPILAYGGGAGAGQGSVSMAAPDDPIASANELAAGRSTRKLQRAQETTAESQARKSAAEADIMELTRDERLANLQADTELKRKGAHAKGQEAELSRFRRYMTHEQTLTERALRGPRRSLLESQIGSTDASAAEHRARTDQIVRNMPEYLFGDEGGRWARTADYGAGVLNTVSGGLGRTIADIIDQVMGRRERERRTSAETVLRDRDVRTREREQDRRDRYEDRRPLEQRRPRRRR